MNYEFIEIYVDYFSVVLPSHHSRHLYSLPKAMSKLAITLPYAHTFSNAMTGRVFGIWLEDNEVGESKQKTIILLT